MTKALVKLFMELVKLFFGLVFILSPIIFIVDVFMDYNILSGGEFVGVMILSMIMYGLLEDK